ncbi:MAG: M48 family metallopeptidase [Pontiellaceae bacterium]|nr:M48 family metallopeptidase [Pontiellaceae bacterium]
MEKRFTYENIAFDYHLIMEDRKTIAATVYPNQSVVVKAPLDATDKRINNFLSRRFRWILKQRRYFSKFKSKAQKQYISGETFSYLGRSYKLLVKETENNPYVSLQHGTLTVFSCFPKNALITKKLLDDWYSKKAKMVFLERLKVCGALFHYDIMPSLTIRRTKKRWGSYSRKTHRIMLNLDLIQASKAQIDYVIIHELCHVTHANHSKAFYALLKEKLPNWEMRKHRLELSLV